MDQSTPTPTPTKPLPPPSNPIHTGSNGRIFPLAPPQLCYDIPSTIKQALLPSTLCQLQNLPPTHRNLIYSASIPARDAISFRAPRHSLIRFTVTHAAQVADVNIWNAANPRERFYSSKTRQIHGSHLTVSDSLWSCMPYIRPLATVVRDTVQYGIDVDGCGVHDVIGSRCDPYTHWVITEGQQSVDDSCHSNLVRSARDFGLSEPDVHDVWNVFMCTGIGAGGHYLVKKSPVKLGDFIEILAWEELIIAVGSCRQGDVGVPCGEGGDIQCWPLGVEVFAIVGEVHGLGQGREVSGYRGGHGLVYKPAK